MELNSVDLPLFNILTLYKWPPKSSIHSVQFKDNTKKNLLFGNEMDLKIKHNFKMTY